MAEALVAVLRQPKDCSNEQLVEVCRFLGTEESSANWIENHENISTSIVSLLEVALEGRADNQDPQEADPRRTRLALCVLVNACNRSEKLRKTVDPKIVNMCRALLRLPEIINELAHFLLAVIPHLHLACALDKDYPQLLAELAILWEQTDENAAISAIFVTLLETDYAFLAHSFADFPLEAFTALMRITDTVLDSSETDMFFKVHSNNIQFCVDLVGRILFDLGDEGEKEGENKQKDYLEQLGFAVECIGSCALRPDEYGNELLAKADAVNLLIDILDSVLDAQAIVEEAEIAASTRPKYADRPDSQISCRIPRVQENSGMLKLSRLLVDWNDERARLKQGCIRAIGNLCCESRINQLAAGERGGVISVLRCTKKHGSDKPFIVQWAIAAIRHMVISCPENQDIIVSIDQKPTGIIDREKLFEELGVEVALDEVTGKMKVLRVAK